MFDMPIDTLIRQIVRSQLPRNAQEDKALLLSFDVRASDFSDEGGGSEAAIVRLAYHCRPGSTYISVFTRVDGRGGRQIEWGPEWGEWVNEANHDSCWTDIRVFNKVYAEMTHRLNAQRVQNGVGPTIRYSRDVSFPLFESDLFRWIDCKVERVEGETYRHRIVVPEGAI